MGRRSAGHPIERALSEIDEDELLAVAREAAEAAATELPARFGERAHGVRSKSTPTDLVSDADVAAEAAIRGVLASRRPDDAIVGEEGGETGSGEQRWVVDPLDGTINYLFGIPVFAVSVACEDASATIAGVVLDPIRGECFEATRSGEPRLNGTPIRSPVRGDLSRPRWSRPGSATTPRCACGRRPWSRACSRASGTSAASARPRIDLCWCACGRFDAYYERGLHAWDVAAGALIASRAGLEVRELPAGEE